MSPSDRRFFFGGRVELTLAYRLRKDCSQLLYLKREGEKVVLELPKRRGLELAASGFEIEFEKKKKSKGKCTFLTWLQPVTERE